MTTTMTISTSVVWLPVYGYTENKVNEWMNVAVGKNVDFYPWVLVMHL
jgi:hypothetical protein